MPPLPPIPPLRPDLLTEVQVQALRAKLDLKWVLAQIEVESSGDPFAFRYEEAFYERYLSRARPPHKYGPLAACSYGLLQILLVVAEERGFAGRPEDLFNPRTHLFYSCQYLAHLLEWAQGGTSRLVGVVDPAEPEGKAVYDQALAAYNAGKGNWNSAVGQEYVSRVHRALSRL